MCWTLLETFAIRMMGCFSNPAAHRWFIVMILGFMLRKENLGVTSAVRALGLPETSYESLIHLYRSTAYTLKGIQDTWCTFIAEEEDGHIRRVNGRAVLIGDGTQKQHHGKYMPAMIKLPRGHDEDSKDSFIDGQFFGSIGVVVQDDINIFCLPLITTIQGGLKETASWEGGDKLRGESHIVQLVHQGVRAAEHLGDSLLVLDRYFLSVDLLREVSEYNAFCQSLPADPETGIRQRGLAVLTRVKKNCAAYLPPPAPQPGRRGRPAKKGARVDFNKVFAEGDFTKATVTMYGKEENVEYLATDLVWGRGLYATLKFVFVKRANGSQAIFACSDLDMDPIDVIVEYSIRFKIEVSFRSEKQDVFGFSNRFWSSSCPRYSKYRKSTDPDPLKEVTDPKDRKRILDAVERTERHVQFAGMALGLLQLLALDSKFRKNANRRVFKRTDRQVIDEDGKVLGVRVSEWSVQLYMQKSFLPLKPPDECPLLKHIIESAKNCRPGTCRTTSKVRK